MNSSPFDFYLPTESGLSESDLNTEIQLLFKKQQAIQDLLNGDVHPSEFLEFLDSFSVDVDEYMESSMLGMELITSGKVEVDE